LEGGSWRSTYWVQYRRRSQRSLVEIGLLKAFRHDASDNPWMSYTVGYGKKVLSGKESAAVAGWAIPKTFSRGANIFQSSGQQII